MFVCKYSVLIPLCGAAVWELLVIPAGPSLGGRTSILLASQTDSRHLVTKSGGLAFCQSGVVNKYRKEKMQ